MKIIKMGKVPPPSTYLGNCHICHTLIEYDEDEVEMTDFSNLPNTYRSKKHCPVCNQVLITVKKNVTRSH